MIRITLCFVFVSVLVSKAVSYKEPGRIYLPPVPYPIIPEVKNPTDFEDYLIQTRKSYVITKEYKFREHLFWYRKHYSETSNDYEKKELRSFLTALNAYSDLTLHEIFKKLSGYKKTYSTYHPQYSTSRLRRQENNSIPDSFDWREKGAVTAVKSQGLESDCGACWAFAVTGAIEGHIAAKTGELTPLSEQNLVDCSKEQGNDGCDGGFPFNGFQYVVENKGIAAGVRYPYTTTEGECVYSEEKKAAEIKDFVVIPPGDENEMKRVIATKGPIACSVHAELDSFILYKSGIYDDQECNDGELDHSILVVGYGTQNGTDYWIIKNSWSEVWGEKGYMKLPRNKNSFCHIAEECSFPIV
ncbi:hypothetical protein ACFFRR_000897 [Megaselia abdita]